VARKKIEKMWKLNEFSHVLHGKKFAEKFIQKFSELKSIVLLDP
jgi:hypothetical protein